MWLKCLEKLMIASQKKLVAQSRVTFVLLMHRARVSAWLSSCSGLPTTYARWPAQHSAAELLGCSALHCMACFCLCTDSLGSWKHAGRHTCMASQLPNVWLHLQAIFLSYGAFEQSTAHLVAEMLGFDPTAAMQTLNNQLEANSRVRK